MYTNSKKCFAFIHTNKKPSTSGVLSAIIIASLSLSGCQTVKGMSGKLFKKDKIDTVQSAENTEQGYYTDAAEDISKQHYLAATKNLKNLRTFYPTGRYSQQALLDLMYVQFLQGNEDEAAASASQFINLYPSNPQVDYAHYVRGVANMTNLSGDLFKTNQAKRDMAYHRLAFGNFETLINKYPNSVYAPDAAKRLTFIYNQFAEHELHIARWYIKREAYVAAATRAKWIFQYYPLSNSTPEAIATLAYSYNMLGMTQLSNEYKTLLKINYPEWLDDNGSVKLSKISKKSNYRTLVNKASFGLLAQADDSASTVFTGQYTGQTKTQLIKNASKMQLPQPIN